MKTPDLKTINNTENVMTGFLLTTLVTALSLLIVDTLFSSVYISNFPTAIIAAIVLGLINSSIRPILSLLSLPINLLTLGLFSFVVNGVCFWLAGVLVPGFSVSGIAAIILGPVILSLGTTFLSSYFADRNLPSFANLANSDKSLESGQK
jgi:putative membrane protein